MYSFSMVYPDLICTESWNSEVNSNSLSDEITRCGDQQETEAHAQSFGAQEALHVLRGDGELARSGNSQEWAKAKSGG